MQHNTLLTLCAAAVVATSAIGLATAKPAKPASLIASMNWRGTTSRDWNTAGNWSGSTVPVAGDIVTIPLAVPDGYQGDPIISNADGLAGDLTIAGPRTVTVTGKTLILDGAVTHDIDGDIFLKFHASNDSVLKVTGAATLDITGTIVLEAGNAVLDLDADVTVQGTGEIKGEHDDAEIQIADGVTFTNNADIVGQMTIKESGSTGTFLNGSTGIVRANADGVGSPAVLLLAAGLTVVDANTGPPKWQATSDTDARLRFDVSATSLNGEFTVSECAQLYLADGIDVHTTGNFIFTANDYEVRTDASATYCFKWNVGGGAPGSICNNVTCP